MCFSMNSSWPGASKNKDRGQLQYRGDWWSSLIWQIPVGLFPLNVTLAAISFVKWSYLLFSAPGCKKKHLVPYFLSPDRPLSSGRLRSYSSGLRQHQQFVIEQPTLHTISCCLSLQANLSRTFCRLFQTIYPFASYLNGLSVAFPSLGGNHRSSLCQC